MKTRKNDPARLRGLFRLYPYFDAVARAWERAVEVSPREDEAFRILIRAMDRWARRPTLEKMMDFLPIAVRSDELAWFALIYAAHRWHRDTPAAVPGFMAMLNAMARSDTARFKSSAIWLALWPRAIELTRSLGDDPSIQMTCWSLEETFATSLAGHRDSVTRMEGRDILLRLKGEMESCLTNNDDEELRGTIEFLYGRCLANLGQTYTDIGLHDDSIITLEKALAFHDQAMAVKARMDLLQSRYHSLRMRSSTRKFVAHRLGEDQALRIEELLDGALADVEEAVALYRKHPEVRGIDGAGILRNLVNTRLAWLSHQLKRGALKHDRAEQMFQAAEELLGEVRSSRDPQVLVGIAETEQGIRQVRALLDGGEQVISLDEVVRLLGSSLATRDLPGGHGVERQTAQAAVRGLLRWAMSSDENLPVVLWPMLAEFLAWMEPEEVGLDVLADAINAEVLLLAREDGNPHDGWDPLIYFREALREFDRRHKDPRLTNAERLLYAGWMRRLVQVRYSWSVQPDSRSMPGVEDFELADRCGSSAWRSDLHFFGAGTVKEDFTVTEHGWRCHLYRTRWERDAAAQVLQVEALSRRLPSDVPNATAWLERLASAQVTCEVLPHETPEDIIKQRAAGADWFHSPDGVVIPKRWTPELAREQLRSMERDLIRSLDYGKHRGWKPSTEEGLTVPDGDEITAWLTTHTDVAVLIVGVGPPRICQVVNGETVWHLIETPEDHPLTDAITAYIEARDDHSFGTVEDATQALSAIGDVFPAYRDKPEIRHAMGTIIATPKATERLGIALEALLIQLGEIIGPVLSELVRSGTRHLLVLPRNWARHVPWGAMHLNKMLLGDQVSVSIVETLSAVPLSPLRDGSTLLYVGGKAGQQSALHLGRVCLGAQADEIAGPLDRDGFEDLARRARVLRVIAHGEALLMFEQASGIILDEAHPEAHNRYAASEMRAMDLGGARRVELWACESGRDDETFRHLFHHDEPGGLDGALLLAGCEVVLSSLWVQYAVSAAMIGEAFALRACQEPNSPEAEVLAWAVAEYRRAVAEGGVFAQSVANRFNKGRCSNEEAITAGLTAWRASIGAVVGSGVVGVSSDVLAQLGRAVPTRSTPQARAVELLTPLRSPVAWAGWKITLRSKEALWPRHG